MGKVWQKIQADNINPTGASSPQQRAYLLLCHMAVGLTPPPPKQPLITVLVPDRALLTAKARVLLWDWLKEPGVSPSAYRGLGEDLWRMRRRV